MPYFVVVKLIKTKGREEHREHNEEVDKEVNKVGELGIETWRVYLGRKAEEWRIGEWGK